MTPFPRAERYLARLPHGFGSYAECMARGSVFRVFTESRSLRHFPWEKAPAGVADMLRTPVQNDAWLPEVQVMATILAVADHHALSDAETVRWFHDANAQLLGNRMYRALMSLASPSLFVKKAPQRWLEFHRGTGIGVTQTGNAAHITLRYPPFLHGELILRGMGEGFKIAISMSRAKDTDVELVTMTPRSAEYRLTWR